MPFLLLFISLVISPLHSATPEELARHPKWIKLLHYKKGPLGGVESEADGKEFFLHPQGKTDPVAELKKSVELFSATTQPTDDHAICKFPLRFKWLNQSLGLPWRADLSGCIRYISFFSKLAAKRASIVFSSYYLSNPNSAFGHTLLRLSRYENPDETEMLDYGINFSAEARGTNPFTYAIKGLTGGFEGRFAAIPYYYKVREYSDAEFRDLWSYDLKLTMPQVLEMVDHIWELGRTHFDYYYFHENCSYHLLSLLDVVLPERDLTSKFKFFTIPADTIRLLHKEGLIEKGKRRESTHSRLTTLSRHLSSKELHLARRIAQSPKDASRLLEGMEPVKAARILDVSLEAFDYYNAENILADHAPTMELKAPLLAARASNPVITEASYSPITEKDSPALGHSPTRLGLATGYQDERGLQGRLELRSAFHDLLDPAAGSLKEGELEMFRFSFLYSQKDYSGEGFYLDHLSFLSIKNYPPQDAWSSPLSWEIGTGIRQVDRISCFACPGFYFTGSAGNSFHLSDRNILAALLLNAEILVHNTFQENYLFGLGPKLYSRIRLSENVVTGVSVLYHWTTSEVQRPLNSNWARADLELRYHFHSDFSLALQAGGFEEKDDWIFRTEAGLQYFY